MKQSKAQKRRIKPKLILPVVAIVVIAIFAAILIKNMSGPAEGRVAYISPGRETIQDIPTKPGTYSGKAVNFSYPGSYDISSGKNSSVALDRLVLYSNDHKSTQVAVEVTQESLANDSGINYRRGHPALYKEYKDALGNPIFIKSQDGSEYTGFIVHGGMVASVSLSSTFARDLSTDYNSIVKTLTWKQ
jgi:hypothetical protein